MCYKFEDINDDNNEHEKEELDMFITKNRAEIDEFLVNQEYVEISLKGQLCKKIGSKGALRLFAFWNEEKLTIKQRIEEMQEILNNGDGNE